MNVGSRDSTSTKLSSPTLNSYSFVQINFFLLSILSNHQIFLQSINHQLSFHQQLFHAIIGQFSVSIRAQWRWSNPKNNLKRCGLCWCMKSGIIQKFCQWNAFSIWLAAHCKISVDRFQDNGFGTCFVIKECLRVMKWENLLSLSTMTIMESNSQDFSKPSIKSILQNSKISSGNGSRCKSPAGVVASTLFHFFLIRSIRSIPFRAKLSFRTMKNAKEQQKRANTKPMSWLIMTMVCQCSNTCSELSVFQCLEWAHGNYLIF